MDDYLYIIIIIGLSIFILFYGGHNYQNKVEYDTKYFDNLNMVIYFESKINDIIKNISFGPNEFININNYLDSTHVLLPNFIDSYSIRIKPREFFNIFNIASCTDLKTNMMIIFNHNKYNSLELLVENTNNNLYSSQCNLSKLNFSNDENFDAYFYSLKKTISITGLYHIYNNSPEEIIISCYIVKKPFWHK